MALAVSHLPQVAWCMRLDIVTISIFEVSCRDSRHLCWGADSSDAGTAISTSCCCCCCFCDAPQMGSCFSSDESKAGASQSNSPGLRQDPRHPSGGGTGAQKNKTPDFGLGDAYQVCCMPWKITQHDVNRQSRSSVQPEQSVPSTAC